MGSTPSVRALVTVRPSVTRRPVSVYETPAAGSVCSTTARRPRLPS
ncbi:hypothetical protein VSR01_34645 [Actinacidiphila sp. DG2A-62]|nr:hypothetical protein [Actinacidiphila sp. DG2A-62]MEC3998355.1 hypothetical protein [Actinacidiphila sp. DG2A-62]